ncbi:MAG: hypothetical protein HRU29_03010 [Rhizobiales bacterium]|nr:hypothetical protein [Hyphomicrobiales bacterium]
MTLWPSWVLFANSKTYPFLFNNLPYGHFSAADKSARCGVAIGDTIIITGKAVGAGYTIGFGECSGKILPTYKN